MSSTFTLPEGSDKLYRGDTIVMDASISQEGKPLALSGYLIWFTAKPQVANADGAPGVIQKTLTNGIVVTDSTNGKIRITIAPADTAQITQETTYQCDIQIKNPAGEIFTTARGTIKIDLDITQSTT